MTTKDEAKNYLRDVYSEQCFWVNNGPVLKNLEELSNALEGISDETYRHHANSERNDFSKWVGEVIGDKKIANKVIPLAVTLMLFFMVNNWLGLLPVVGPITYGEEHAPLFRGVAADLNTTLALAVISIVTAQAWAIKRRGFFGNAKRYLGNPLKDPLHAAIGLLEIIAEFSRTAALSLRMFGNVFGGEVLLVVIAFLTSYAAAIALPVFYGLELFVGAVQAYVFFMLTIAFISLGLPSADEEHGSESHDTGDAPVRMSKEKV